MKKIYVLFFCALLSATLNAQKVTFRNSILPITAQFRNILKLSDANKSELDHARKFAVLQNRGAILKNAVSNIMLDSIDIQAYDSINSAWNPAFSDKFTYNMDGENTLYAGYTWNFTTGSPDPNVRIEYDYDSNGYLTGIHNFSRDSTVAYIKWNETLKILYSVSSEGNINESTTYAWDDAAGDLEPALKIDFTYDAAGNDTEEDNYVWDTDLNDWTLGARTVNTYDANNNITDSEFSVTSDGSFWLTYSKDEYTYDSGGLLSQKISYQLNYMTLSLDQSAKEEYTYNSDGNNTEVMYYKWQAGIWDPDKSEEYQFDSNGNMISMIDKTNPGDGNLVNNTKTEISYNTSFASDNIILPEITAQLVYYSSVTNMVTGYTSYQWTNGQWMNKEKAALYYTNVNSTLAGTVPEKNISIYPVPAASYLNIQNNSPDEEEAILISSDGRVMLERNFTNHISLPVGNIPSGIYVVKVKSMNGEDFMKQIVIR